MIEEILDLIREERAAQDEKWGPQQHNLSDWLAILVEEVGEFAAEGAREWPSCQDALAEVVQVAAVATAIAEQLLPLVREEEAKPCPDCGIPLGEGDHTDCLPF